MVVLVDLGNKEVIKLTGTKASTFLYQNKENLNLKQVASCHSSQKMQIDLSLFGMNNIISATEYVKKYNISIK